MIKVPQDTDPFPFGAHRGKPYGTVPAGYLDFIIDKDWINKWPEVVAYINANRRIIDKELEERDYDEWDNQYGDN